MMMPRERIEEIVKFLKSIDLELTENPDLVDKIYITKLLGQCDDYTQKFEEFIIEVSLAGTLLENVIDDKKDLYEASHQELLTTDPTIKLLSTGAERANAAKYKLRDLTKEIKEFSAEFKELNTLKTLLVRNAKRVGNTATTVKKQYEARVGSMRHQFLGERETVSIPGSVLAEDPLLEQLNKVDAESIVEEESADGAEKGDVDLLDL